ncbi:uncharacterized protein LOC126802237 [Argentina anserina]|uniref:uncharacterized protein LOC126802237 n=1 Tax=Argentina anserina TaxID=57926 RepID=UPI00217650C0|nr:uncharacterized protein LOC126802237 [Potentilla anserina]
MCWSRAKFPNNKAIIDALSWELKGLHEGPLSGVSRVREEEICGELDAAWACEELFWKQRSRVNWRLDETLLAVESQISDSDNLSLSKSFSLDEVRKAVMQLGNWKAPGPDGYPGHFYKEHWEVVCETINRAVACFTNGDSSLNAFVPGRLIHANLILAHEAYHYLKLKRSKHCHEFALKLDMQKAYDRVEWDFFEVALLKFGFKMEWVKLIMKVVTSVSFSIMINGKQGSYLILQEAYVKVTLYRLTCSLLWEKCCREILRLRLEKEIFRVLSLVLSVQGSLTISSGQAVNLGKSLIFFSANSPIEIREMVAAELQIPINPQPGIYLGLPTIWENSKKSAMAYIRERINQKIQGWKANILSQAGREVLIKAVAMAVPAYPMAIFLLPKTLCKSINSDLSKFWWGFNESKDKMHWKSWDDLCRGKFEGGLGFKNLHAYNLALLAKHCWRLVNNPSSLWARVLKARYFPHVSFMKAKKGSKASCIWNSMLAGRDVVVEKSIWRVGNGKSIDVWDDRWVPNNNGGRISPTDMSNRFTPLLVADLMDSQRNWNINNLEEFLSKEDKCAISAIPIWGGGEGQ